MNKKILLPLAEGFETIEALTVVDIFRRAKFKVDMAAIGEKQTVLSSHQIIIQADILLADCLQNDYDAIVLPGGLKGSENLRDCPELITMLKKQNTENKLYAAICAAPALVLEYHGLLEGKKATCFPSMLNQIPENKRENKPVVISQNCITGQGAGYAIDFSLAILEKLAGQIAKDEIEKQLAFKY